MLNVMRDNLRHLKWVLWLVAIAMVLSLGLFFDIGGGSPAGADASWAARVEGGEIPARRLVSTAQNMDRYYRELFGTGYDQLKGNIRVGSQAIRQLINEEIILQDARRMGLIASDEDIAEAIRTDPNFTDEGGRFVGKERYVQAVNRAYPGGVAAYEARVADEVVMDRWADLISQPIRITEQELEEAQRERTEKTSIRYFVVASADQTAASTPSDDEIGRWYEEHPSLYERDEGRRIRYVVVERAAQRAKVVVTDEELRASYDANQANYTHPEQRRARHILFRVPPDADETTKASIGRQAEDVLQRLRDGAEFEELAQAMSQDPGSARKGGDLDFFGRGAMVPPFEKAAFETPVGELAGVTETDFGFHVIQVTDARDAGVTDFEEVKDEIRRSLELRKAEERVVAEGQRLREEMQTAELFATVAEREELAVESRFVATDDPLRELGASPDFNQIVFDLEPGSISPPIRVSRGLALVLVDERVPPSVAPLDEVINSVRGDLLNDRAAEAALEQARRAVDSTGTLQAAAERLEKELQESGELSRGQSPSGTGGATDELEAKLFGDAVQPGDRGTLRVPAGALVYEVVSRQAFDPVAFEAAKPTLRAELFSQRRSLMQRSVVDKLFNDLLAEQKIETNQPLVDRLDRLNG